MSTSSGIIEFLNELSETDALAALRNAHGTRSPFIFKIDGHEHSIKAFINTFTDKKIIITPDPPVNLPLEKEISIKFLVGTEVYFIKTVFKTYMNHFYVDMGVKVIQLKRRKEPRFHIPKGWNQSGAIFLPKANEILKCSLIDISKSGVRFEVLDQIKTTFKRDDILKIKFQIHKRAEVQTTAIVRFALHRPNANSIIGMEFATISEVQNERVSSIVEDIQMFNSTQKS